MKESFKKKLRIIRDLYCYTDFFLNRGLGIFNAFYQVIKYTAFAGIIVGMINEIIGKFGFFIPMENVIFFVPIFMVILIIAGILDVKKIKVLQKTNEISTRLNPYLVKLIERNKVKK